MRFRMLAFITSTALLACSFAFAQTQPGETDPEKEKKKKAQEERVVQMLDQAIGDAATLRLPQNRAIVCALAGDLVFCNSFSFLFFLFSIPWSNLSCFRD